MKGILIAALLSMTAPMALAQGAHAGHASAAPAGTPSEVVNVGEVKRVNAKAKKVTIAHGPLKAFDMPAMTMAFAVKDATMVSKLKPGDKVKFVLEKSGEDLVITRIEPAS